MSVIGKQMRRKASIKHLGKGVFLMLKDSVIENSKELTKNL